MRIGLPLLVIVGLTVLWEMWRLHGFDAAAGITSLVRHDDVVAGPSVGLAAGALDGFDEDSLRSLGLDEAKIAALRAHFTRTRSEIERLRRQTSEQYGTFPNAGFVSGLDRTIAGLQARIGPLDYDRLLYAAGQPNRLRVEKVEADVAIGLRTGDLVIRYNGVRVFNRRDLQRAASRGAAGTPIPIEVSRRGESVSLTTPRTPLERLGVVLEAVRMTPEHA